MLKILLFVPFANALVTQIEDFAYENGYLYHAIDFVSNTPPDELVQHWGEHGWYMDSFSFLNAISPKCAGNLGVLLDPKHESVTTHLLANENINFNTAVKERVPIQNKSWNDACDSTNDRELQRINTLIRSGETIKVTAFNKCYEGRLRNHAKPYFEKARVFSALRKNERSVKEYSEIVVSASFDAVKAVIFGPGRLRTVTSNWRAPNPRRGTAQVAADLCRAARAIKRDVECIFLDNSNEFKSMVERWNNVNGNQIPDLFPEIPEIQQSLAGGPNPQVAQSCNAAIENLPGFIEGVDGDDCLDVADGETCTINRANMECAEHFCNNGKLFPQKVSCTLLDQVALVSENVDLRRELNQTKISFYVVLSLATLCFLILSFTWYRTVGKVESTETKPSSTINADEVVSVERSPSVSLGSLELPSMRKRRSHFNEW